MLSIFKINVFCNKLPNFKKKVSMGTFRNTYQERKPKAVLYILYIPSRLILLDLKHQEKPWKPVPQQGLMGGGDRKYSSK